MAQVQGTHVAARGIGFRRVLVPVEGSALDDVALSRAREIASAGASIIVVAVGELAETSAHAAEERRALSLVVGEARRKLLPFPTRGVVLASGDVARGIVTAAADERADVIVMAIHTHGGLRRLGRRGIAEWVSAHAPVPVLVCHPPVSGQREADSRVERGRPAGASPQAPAPSATGVRGSHRYTARRPDRCRLWSLLRTGTHMASGRGAEPVDEPEVFLLFRHTGLLVGLPDEHATAVQAAGEAFSILATDALGLGLTPEDIADGVALCSGDDGVGWRCATVDLALIEADGGSRVMREADALRELLPR